MMRTRKRSKDQLRAIHASYANGYKRKGYRKKQKVVLKPKRVIKHTKITKTPVPKKEKAVYNPSNSKKEKTNRELVAKQEILNEYDDIEINTLQEAKTLNQVRNLMGNEIYHVTTKENFKIINKEGLRAQKEDYWNMDRTGIFLTTEKSVAQRYASNIEDQTGERAITLLINDDFNAFIEYDPTEDNSFYTTENIPRNEFTVTKL